LRIVPVVCRAGYAGRPAERIGVHYPADATCAACGRIQAATNAPCLGSSVPRRGGSSRRSALKK